MSNLGRNQMLFDFGFEPANFNNSDAVRNKIEQIEQQFDLILMADRLG